MGFNRHFPVTEYQPFLHRATPDWPRLRSDLPEVDERCFGNLAHSAWKILTSKRYSYRHSHFCPLQPFLQSDLHCKQNAPLPPSAKGGGSLSSALCLSLDHFRRHGFHPVSCYAFFKRWLLLSQLPGCLKTMTSLTTEQRVRGLRCESGLFPFRRTSLAPHVCLLWGPQLYSKFD